jgi:hypothetical protein
VSIFLDSSDWKTDMHVYVRTDTDPNTGRVGWCSESGKTVVSDPQINSAPANWSYYPTDSATITGSYQEIFTAASKSGTTSFSVTYDVKCQDDDGGLTDVGQVKFSGKVPDNLNSDEFKCEAETVASASGEETPACKSSEGGGYHVDAHADLVYELEQPNAVNDQITD